MIFVTETKVMDSERPSHCSFTVLHSFLLYPPRGPVCYFPEQFAVFILQYWSWIAGTAVYDQGLWYYVVSMLVISWICCTVLDREVRGSISESAAVV